MPAIPTEYEEVANRLARLLNSLVIREKATELALRHLGITEEQWKAAVATATQVVGWKILPERNTKTLTDAFHSLLETLGNQ